MKYKQNHFQIYCFKIIIIIVIASQRKYSSQINRFFKNAKKKKKKILDLKQLRLTAIMKV